LLYNKEMKPEQVIYAQRSDGSIIPVDPAHSYLEDWANHYDLKLYRFDKQSLDHTLFLLKYGDQIERFG